MAEEEALGAVGEADKAGGAAKKGAEPKKADYRLEDTRLDGKLEDWPMEPPKAAKTNLERARLELIASPGEVHRLAGRFSDVGRASKLATAFVRAKPSTLYAGATGAFEARPYFDPSLRKWRVAARYVPGETDVALQS